MRRREEKAVSTLKYWIWLSTREELHRKTIERLLERFGDPEAVYEADREAYGTLALRPEEQKALEEKDLTHAHKILDTCDYLDIWVMTRQDAEYPARLRSIPNAPFVLYGKGRRIRFDEEPAIAIVGTRKCSSYGRKIAYDLGARLTRQGMLVVSGLARGIDAEAAKGALHAGGPTAAVLGCGIDVIYPQENERLYHSVAEYGTLLSEYPPGTRPLGAHFPARNRIISGLSLGTVVVEAPVRSGELITARHAMEQERDVFAVPGNIDLPLSAGPNRLLRTGAIPVLRADDVVSEYIHRFPDRLRLAREVPETADFHETEIQPESPGVSLQSGKKEVDKRRGNDYIDLNDVLEPYHEKEKVILRALEPEPMQIDRLAERTQMQPQELLPLLTLLELRGVVLQAPGKCFYRLGDLRE